MHPIRYNHYSKLETHQKRCPKKWAIHFGLSFLVFVVAMYLTLSLIFKSPPCVICLMMRAAFLEAATDADSIRNINSADIFNEARDRNL